MPPSDSQKSQSNANFPPAKAVGSPVERATIGRSLVITGEVSGSESLYIDGRIDGTVDFAGHTVTIGANGTVAAGIIASEVVILGKVVGDIECTDRVEIRSAGWLSGNVVTQRISVAEGAILEGSVEVRAPEQKTNKAKQAKAEQAMAEAEEPAAIGQPASAPPATTEPAATIEQPAAVERPRAAAAAAGSQTSFQSVHQSADPGFAERTRTMIRAGYKPKDAADLVLQEIALEYRSDASVMEKARADAETFLLKISKGLI